MQPFAFEELVCFSAAQLWLNAGLIELYRKRQPTISEHQQTIAGHLRLRPLDDAGAAQLEQFLFEESCVWNRPPPLSVEGYLRSRRDQGRTIPVFPIRQRLRVILHYECLKSRGESKMYFLISLFCHALQFSCTTLPPLTWSEEN
jgi:hypothetical protein